MKKFLLTAVLSLGLLEMPAWGLWYSVTDSAFEEDTNRGTVAVRTKYIDIYFVEKDINGLHPFVADDADDAEDKVDEVEEIIEGWVKVKFWNLTFNGAQHQADLDLMEMMLKRFARGCNNMRCEEAAPEIKVAWDELYREETNQINKAIYKAEERARENEQGYEDLLDSNGPGVGIMKAVGGYFSGADSDGEGSHSGADSERESSEEADEGSYD